MRIHFFTAPSFNYYRCLLGYPVVHTLQRFKFSNASLVMRVAISYEDPV